MASSISSDSKVQILVKPNEKINIIDDYSRPSCLSGEMLETFRANQLARAKLFSFYPGTKVLVEPNEVINIKEEYSPLDSYLSGKRLKKFRANQLARAKPFSFKLLELSTGTDSLRKRKKASEAYRKALNSANEGPVTFTPKPLEPSRVLQDSVFSSSDSEPDRIFYSCEDEDFSDMDENFSPEEASPSLKKAEDINVYEGEEAKKHFFTLLGGVFGMSEITPATFSSHIRKLEKIESGHYIATFPGFEETKMEIHFQESGVFLSGSELQEKMKTLIRKTLGSSCHGVFPYDQIEKVELLGSDRFKIYFKGPLEGTTSNVAKGGWQDMKYSRLVMGNTLTVALSLSDQKVTLEGNGLQMGIHAEDYDFVSNLSRNPSAVKVGLRAFGYIGRWNGKPAYGLGFSGTVKKIRRLSTQDGLGLSLDIHGKDGKVIPSKKGKTPLPCSQASGTLLAKMRSEVGQIPLKYEVFDATFSRFKWEVTT